jgi:hypothetical protein
MILDQLADVMIAFKRLILASRLVPVPTELCLLCTVLPTDGLFEITAGLKAVIANGFKTRGLTKRLLLPD